MRVNETVHFMNICLWPLPPLLSLYIFVLCFSLDFLFFLYFSSFGRCFAYNFFFFFRIHDHRISAKSASYLVLLITQFCCCYFFFPFLKGKYQCNCVVGWLNDNVHWPVEPPLPLLLLSILPLLLLLVFPLIPFNLLFRYSFFFYFSSFFFFHSFSELLWWCKIIFSLIKHNDYL